MSEDGKSILQREREEAVAEAYSQFSQTSFDEGFAAGQKAARLERPERSRVFMWAFFGAMVVYVVGRFV